MMDDLTTLCAALLGAPVAASVQLAAPTPLPPQHLPNNTQTGAAAHPSARQQPHAAHNTEAAGNGSHDTGAAGNGQAVRPACSLAEVLGLAAACVAATAAAGARAQAEVTAATATEAQAAPEAAAAAAAAVANGAAEVYVGCVAHVACRAFDRVRWQRQQRGQVAQGGDRHRVGSPGEGGGGEGSGGGGQWAEVEAACAAVVWLAQLAADPAAGGSTCRWAQGAGWGDERGTERSGFGCLFTFTIYTWMAADPAVGSPTSRWGQGAGRGAVAVWAGGSGCMCGPGVAGAVGGGSRRGRPCLQVRPGGGEGGEGWERRRRAKRGGRGGSGGYTGLRGHVCLRVGVWGDVHHGWLAPGWLRTPPRRRRPGVRAVA